MASRHNPNIALPPHGGDLRWASARYGIAVGDWLDLSTGLNPWPYPLPKSDQAGWSRLPTGDREEALMSAARQFYGAGPKAGLVAAPGTQALIQWLPRTVPASTVAVIGPTYAEHATAWFRAGHDVIEAEDLSGIGAATDIVIVVNPNNPDGRFWAREDLLKISRGLAERGGFILVDEAFGDLDPGNSLASEAGRPGLVILKSFGKFFGLAGLRLGFALGPKSMQQALSECLGPWAVATPAIDAGIAALNDRNWADQTRTRLAEARTQLDGVLQGAGLSIWGGTDLFRLVQDDRALALFDHLGQQGILTRVFTYDATWLRLGLPGDEAQMQRLAQALADFW